MYGTKAGRARSVCARAPSSSTCAATRIGIATTRAADGQRAQAGDQQSGSGHQRGAYLRKLPAFEKDDLVCWKLNGKALPEEVLTGRIPDLSSGENEHLIIAPDELAVDPDGVANRDLAECDRCRRIEMSADRHPHRFY